MTMAMVGKAMVMVTKTKGREQMAEMVAMAMPAAMMAMAGKAMAMAMVGKAMAMVTKAKVVEQQMAAMMASRESEVPGVAACPLGDDWEIPDTRRGPTFFLGNTGVYQILETSTLLMSPVSDKSQYFRSWVKSCLVLSCLYVTPIIGSAEQLNSYHSTQCLLQCTTEHIVQCTLKLT